MTCRRGNGRIGDSEVEFIERSTEVVFPDDTHACTGKGEACNVLDHAGRSLRMLEDLTTYFWWKTTRLGGAEPVCQEGVELVAPQAREGHTNAYASLEREELVGVEACDEVRESREDDGECLARSEVCLGDEAELAKRFRIEPVSFVDAEDAVNGLSAKGRDELLCRGEAGTPRGDMDFASHGLGDREKGRP
jgi:hypothetical protein